MAGIAIVLARNAILGSVVDIADFKSSFTFNWFLYLFIKDEK